MTPYTLLRDLIPRPMRQYFRRKFARELFSGEYATWSEARARATGYGADAVLDVCLAAGIAVKEGKALFERDGVLFYHDLPDQGILSGLRFIAEQTGGVLRILDFGGSFGSVYFRHKHQLQDMRLETWDIIEQQRFVAEGRIHFADTLLRFFASVGAAEGACQHNVLLCSTAFQYFDDPWGVFRDWEAVGFRYIFFNNLPLIDTGEDIISVQQVPRRIYNATYPVRFFSRCKFMERVGRTYSVEKEFASEAVWVRRKKDLFSTGLVLKKKGDSVEYI